MQRVIAGVTVLVFVAAMGIAQEEVATAENEGISYGATAAFLSRYVSRGAVVSGNPVLQMEAWVTCGSFTFDTWNNVDLTDCQVAPWRLTESDWAISYSFALPRAEMAVGYLYYTYPNLHFDDTQEVFATAAFDVFLSPELTVYYDCDEVHGAYTSASVSYSLPIVKRGEDDQIAADFAALVGYGDSNYVGGCFDDVGSGLVDLVLSCEVPLKISESVALIPQIGYMQVLDDDLRQCTDKSDAFYTGIAVTAEF